MRRVIVPSRLLLAMVASVLIGGGVAQGDYIVGWGDDINGVLTGIPTGNDFTAISAGHSHGLALKLDGSIVGWGLDAWGMLTGIPTGNGFTAVAGGYTFSWP